MLHDLRETKGWVGKRSKMRFKNTGLVISVGLASLGAAGAGVFFRSSNQDPPPYDVQWAAHEPQRRARFEGRAAKLHVLIKNGMESGKCGFHIVEPPREGSFLDSDASGGADYSVWDWWWSIPVYPEEHTDALGTEMPSLLVSTERVFSNSVATLTKVPGANGWDVEATFDQNGLDVLSAAHGPLYSNAYYRDWYGVVHENGGDASVMDVALVLNNQVLLSFSASDLVDSYAPQVVVVARDLLEWEADYVVAKFTGS